MTPPADLAALRKLVEAALQHRHDEPWQRAHTCGMCAALPAAREALERVEKQEGCEVCGHRKGALQTGSMSPWAIMLKRAEARLASLEGALRDLLTCRHGDEQTCGHQARARAALKAQPTRDDECPSCVAWLEAGEQARRDVAHWRKLAENAEARLVREGRDE